MYSTHLGRRESSLSGLEALQANCGSEHAAHAFRALHYICGNHVGEEIIEIPRFDQRPTAIRSILVNAMCAKLNLTRLARKSGLWLSTDRCSSKICAGIMQISPQNAPVDQVSGRPSFTPFQWQNHKRRKQVMLIIRNSHCGVSYSHQSIRSPPPSSFEVPFSGGEMPWSFFRPWLLLLGAAP